jgi:hypothetical protein
VWGPMHEPIDSTANLEQLCSLEQSLLVCLLLLLAALRPVSQATALSVPQRESPPLHSVQRCRHHHSACRNLPSSNSQSLRPILPARRSINKLQQSGQSNPRSPRCPPAARQQRFSNEGRAEHSTTSSKPLAHSAHTICSPNTARYSTEAQTTSKYAATKRSSVSLRNMTPSCSTSVCLLSLGALFSSARQRQDFSPLCRID